MRIHRLQIENFKRLETLDVVFSELDCLVGANNSGKTTLLQALALFDFCVHHCLHRKNGHLEIKRRTIPPEDFYVLPLASPMDIWTDRKAMAKNRQRVVRIQVEFDNGDVVVATVKLDFNRFGVAIEASDSSPDGLNRLRELRIAYLPVFSAFLPQEERRLNAAIEDELGRGRVNSVIRNLLLQLKDQQRHLELIEILQRSFPALKGLRIDFDEVSDRYISVTYKEHERPKEFDIYSAGSGFQQFLYLFGFVLLKQPSVILLDEPDVHLHGSLQGVMLDEFRRFVDAGRQVLFATHSRDLIERVSPDAVLFLDEGEVTRLRIGFDIYDALDSLGSLDPTQLSVVQAYGRVVVVEDRSDHDLLALFCSTCLGPEVWHQVERRIAFCYSKGNPWKQHDMAKLRGMLQQMLSGSSPGELELFIVADRDYYPDLSELRVSLARPHLHWHIWERAEIENYLLEWNALARLAGKTSGQRTIDEFLFEAEFHRLIDSCRNIANDKLVQAFDESRKRLGERWSAADMARKAREFLDLHWTYEKVALADAKDVVLPSLKRWLQDADLGQFSDRALAEALQAEDLPKEVHDLAHSLAEFARIKPARKGR